MINLGNLTLHTITKPVLKRLLLSTKTDFAYKNKYIKMVVDSTLKIYDEFYLPIPNKNSGGMDAKLAFKQNNKSTFLISIKELDTPILDHGYFKTDSEGWSVKKYTYRELTQLFVSLYTQ